MKHLFIAWLLIVSTPNVLSFRSMPTHAFGTAKPFVQNSRHASGKLCATVSSFEDRFGRWKFLRDLLDGDVEGDVINRVMYNVLSNYLNNPPAAASQDATLGSPQLTQQLVAQLEEVLDTSSDGSIVAFADDADDKLIEKLENLLPDPLEDEDAHRSAWDTVIEIHGRDMVKANETNPTTEWRKLCLAARLLIHYDFLSRSFQF